MGQLFIYISFFSFPSWPLLFCLCHLSTPAKDYFLPLTRYTLHSSWPPSTPVSYPRRNMEHTGSFSISSRWFVLLLYWLFSYVRDGMLSGVLRLLFSLKPRIADRLWSDKNLSSISKSAEVWQLARNSRRWSTRLDLNIGHKEHVHEDAIRIPRQVSPWHSLWQPLPKQPASLKCRLW